MTTIDLHDPDFFSNHIPLWREVLAPLIGTKNLRFLEVGSLYGKSASWLLENILTHPSSTLTCIDLFSQSHESLAYCKAHGLHQFAAISPGEGSFERMFDERIVSIGATNRVIKIVAESDVALRSLSHDTYDCIYIDGSHTARGVLTDLVISWSLLKMQGILIIDDYTLAIFTDNPRKNPKIGIDAFLTVFKDEYALLHSGAQVIVRKIASKEDLWI